MREALARAWTQWVELPADQIVDGAAELLPKLLVALFVVAVGWVVARLLQAVTAFALRRLGADRMAARGRLSDALGDAGLASPISTLAARLLFWGVLLTFVLLALKSTGFRAVDATLERLVAFLPNLFAAAVIVAVGIPFARLARYAVASAVAAVGASQAQRIGGAAKVGVTLLVAVLAISQLGIQTELLVTVITTLVATVGLSIGLAFALGARPIVTHILAGHFLRRDLAPGSPIEVAGRRGEVQLVGPIGTTIVDGERQWTVPNDRLLNETYER